MASVRAHTNLNLFLAERALDGLETGAFQTHWGEHSELLALDTAVFRLQVAYRSHLADLCEQKQLTLRPQSAVEAKALIEAQNEFVPEILELVEREQTQSWLSALLEEDFLPAAAVVGTVDGVDLIARSDDLDSLRSPETLRAIAAELKALFVRHRETQQEY